MWEVGLFLLLAAVGRQAIEPGAGLDPEAEAAAWDDRGDLHASRDELEPAAAAYSKALEIRRSAGTKTLALSRSAHGLGVVTFLQGRLDLAEEHGRRALAIREELAPESLEVAESLDLLCRVAWRGGSLERAEALCRRALAIAERVAPDGEPAATHLNRLGSVLETRGEMQAAGEYLQRALAIAQQVAPGSRAMALTLHNLAILALDSSDLETAASYGHRAATLLEELAPDGLDAAAVARTLGRIARERGEPAAEGYLQKALAIYQRRAPDSLFLALVYQNLAGLAIDRGDLESAQQEIRRALEMLERLAPGGREYAAAMGNLAEVIYLRGDLELAASYYRRALELVEKASPGSLDLALALNRLAAVAADLGRPDEAEPYIRRSIELFEKLVPGSLRVAAALNTAAQIAIARGDLALAERHLLRDLELSQKAAPDTLGVAATLSQLAGLAHKRDDLQGLEVYARRALAIEERLAPETSDHAWLLHVLGALSRHRGRNPEALRYFERCIEVLEAQAGRIGGPQETQADFHAQTRLYYQDAIELLVKEGQAERAFHLLERSRARGLLALLAERDLAFAEQIPAELRQARERLAAEYDRVQQSIADLDPQREQVGIAAQRDELRKLRERSSEITAEIRRTSPRLGALRFPQPLDLRGVREALDPGSLMLSYSVGGERTLLFTVASEGPLQVVEIPRGQEELRREVESFRALIAEARGDSRLGAARLRSLKQAARGLYASLLGPAADTIGKAARLLILPDGPLHALPWGALVRPPGGGTSGREEYLAEWKPLHVALSATVYADLRRSRSSGGGAARPALVAFGDPRFPRLPDRESLQSIADERVRSLAERGFAFDPLPASRAEVEGIARLYEAEATAYLGEAATEERAKSAAAGSARILHFATHATLDPDLPLNSALVFTLPERFSEGRDNGLLQAWEIFEGVRFDADLVVLSACDSGLGKELGGDGLLGLTRAFHYAGARSVAASLWKVSDRTTGELMVRFHRHLRSGKSKDEALRAAQLELLRGPIRVRDEQGRETEIDASSPYYWAAFQIFGDWR